MDNLLDVMLILVQVIGLVLAVSVVTSALLLLYLIIGTKIHNRIYVTEEFIEDVDFWDGASWPPSEDVDHIEIIEAIEDIDDIKDYLIKQAEHEKFFQQIEEYRNDFR